MSRPNGEGWPSGDVCPPEHKHGVTGTCYVSHKCRCDECRAGRAAAARRRNKLKAYGRFDRDSKFVDAQPVRDHVNELRAAGIGWKRVAELSGVGNTAISQLVYGRKGSKNDPRKGEELKRVLRSKADKIMAVQAEDVLESTGGLVPAIGVHRRIQALAYMGWSLAKIGRLIGVQRANMNSLLLRKTVTVGMFKRVDKVYRELWDKRPAHDLWREKIAYERTVRMARDRHWKSALAWDDIDSDVRPVKPGDEFSVDAAEERRVEVARLHACRMSDRQIAETLGVTDRTVQRDRQVLGLPGWDRGQVAA